MTDRPLSELRPCPESPAVPMDESVLLGGFEAARGQPVTFVRGIRSAGAHRAIWLSWTSKRNSGPIELEYLRQPLGVSLLGITLSVLGIEPASLAWYATPCESSAACPFLEQPEPAAERALPIPAAQRAPSRGHVYFIQGATSGLIKIGFANDPQKRLRYLQVGSAERLTLLGFMPGEVSAERALHHRFAADRVHGEWFRPSEALLAFVHVRAGGFA